MSNEAQAIHHQVDDLTNIDDVKRMARGWMDAAAMHLRNETYYRGICEEIGKTFGPEVYVQDDGGICEDVLIAKLPEIARARAQAMANG